jgi:hypothetical protein
MSSKAKTSKGVWYSGNGSSAAGKSKNNEEECETKQKPVVAGCDGEETSGGGHMAFIQYNIPSSGGWRHEETDGPIGIGGCKEAAVPQRIMSNKHRLYWTGAHLSCNRLAELTALVPELA